MRECGDPFTPCHRVIGAGGAPGRLWRLPGAQARQTGRRGAGSDPDARAAVCRPCAGAGNPARPPIAGNQARPLGRANPPRAAGTPTNTRPAKQRRERGTTSNWPVGAGTGDPAAFEALYRAHAGRLFGLVSRMLGSAPEAEDVLQDVFVSAHRKMGRVQGRVEPGHLALPAGREPLPGPPAQPRRADGPRHGVAGRTRRPSSRRPRSPRVPSADQPHRSRTGDRAAAARVPRGVHPPRRGGPGPSRSGGDAGHLRGHLEIAGAQGADAAATAADRAHPDARCGTSPIGQVGQSAMTCDDAALLIDDHVDGACDPVDGRGSGPPPGHMRERAERWPPTCRGSARPRARLGPVAPPAHVWAGIQARLQAQAAEAPSPRLASAACGGGRIRADRVRPVVGRDASVRRRRPASSWRRSRPTTSFSRPKRPTRRRSTTWSASPRRRTRPRWPSRRSSRCTRAWSISTRR